MRKSKFAEEQILAALKHGETTAAEEGCRKVGFSRDTYFAWKRQFGEMYRAQAKRLKRLEDESGRLKSSWPSRPSTTRC